LSKFVVWLPTWKLMPSTVEPDPVGLEDQVHRLARLRAELGGQLHHRAGVRHLQAQRQARRAARAS
jgi:hypothetical protein